MWTKAFWKKTVERMVKTFAQAALALLGVDGAGLLDIDWGQVASVSALAAVVSLVTSLASSLVGDDEDPSLV